MAEHGYVSARVTTSNGDLPIVGAVLSVILNDSNMPTLLGKRTTDTNGLTTSVPVPAPDKSMSLSPSEEKPYTNVDIRVDKDGYYTVFIKDAQVFAGETSVAGVSLIPFAENEQFDNMSEIFQETPQNL